MYVYTFFYYLWSIYHVTDVKRTCTKRDVVSLFSLTHLFHIFGYSFKNSLIYMIKASVSSPLHPVDILKLFKCLGIRQSL